MRRPVFLCFFLFVFVLLGGSSMISRPVWGFWGHRKINRMAVFTLPLPLVKAYKLHIEYLTEHAVDPDKRRYATRHEAVRHYIDADHWGTIPFPELPRDWPDALARYTQLFAVTDKSDTIQIMGNEVATLVDSVWQYKPESGFLNILNTPERRYRSFITRKILPQYYEDEWTITPGDLQGIVPLPAGTVSIVAKDHFSEYGILPYHLLKATGDLTEAFRQKNADRVLRLSAEIGHYIGDAHVPLHTTENYNGQMTGQDGIHGFWESRLPELYADSEYDYFVGKAEYIKDLKLYFWDVVITSHSLVDSVLGIEKSLSQTFPRDQQYCYEERLGITLRMPCEPYAKAYHDRMQGMVETRLRQTILAVGNIWYTAWVNAGQPDTDFLLKRKPETQPDDQAAVDIPEAVSTKAGKKADTKTRSHDQ